MPFLRLYLGSGIRRAPQCYRLTGQQVAHAGAAAVTAQRGEIDFGVGGHALALICQRQYQAAEIHDLRLPVGGGGGNVGALYAGGVCADEIDEVLDRPCLLGNALRCDQAAAGFTR